MVLSYNSVSRKKTAGLSCWDRLSEERRQSVEMTDCRTMKVAAAEFCRACIRIAACVWNVNIVCWMEGEHDFAAGGLVFCPVSSGQTHAQMAY